MLLKLGELPSYQWVFPLKLLEVAEKRESHYLDRCEGEEGLEALLGVLTS